MKRDILLWQFAGFAFTVFLGTLLHFLYSLTNQSTIVAPFSAVNESTWEHMKLLYFPMLVFSFIQSKFFNAYQNFWCIKLTGIVIGLILIPIIFYTLNGVFGKTPDLVNIAIFFVSAFLTFLLEARLLKSENFNCFSPKIAFLLILFIGFLFVIFTFFPPKIPLFKNPLSK